MDLTTKLKTRISKDEIEELIQAFDHHNLSFEEIITSLQIKEAQFQASWLMTHLIEKKPSILKESHIKLFAEIVEKTTHEGVERNIWRSLSFIKIPIALHEDWINLAFDKLENSKTAVAIQAFSMKVLEKLLIDEPELQLALKAVLELKLEQQPTPGIRSCATKIISKINSRIRN